MVHTHYKSLQYIYIDCIIMQLDHYLGSSPYMQRGWHSHSSFHAKVFILRLVIGWAISLGSTLKRRGPGWGTCFFCTIPLEDNNTHRLIKCPIVYAIFGSTLSDIWQVNFFWPNCYERQQQRDFFVDMFKTVPMTSRRRYSNLFDIGPRGHMQQRVIGIWVVTCNVMLSCWIV